MTIFSSPKQCYGCKNKCEAFATQCHIGTSNNQCRFAHRKTGHVNIPHCTHRILPLSSLPPFSGGMLPIEMKLIDRRTMLTTSSTNKWTSTTEGIAVVGNSAPGTTAVAGSCDGWWAYYSCFRCGCKECVTSRQEDSLRHSRSRINAYRSLASPSLIALSSKDPILTAFELSWELRRLSFMEHEFKIEYQVSWPGSAGQSVDIPLICPQVDVDLWELSIWNWASKLGLVISVSIAVSLSLNNIRATTELRLISMHSQDLPPFEHREWCTFFLFVGKCFRRIILNSGAEEAVSRFRDGPVGPHEKFLWAGSIAESRSDRTCLWTRGKNAFEPAEAGDKAAPEKGMSAQLLFYTIPHSNLGLRKAEITRTKCLLKFKHCPGFSSKLWNSGFAGADWY